MEQGFPGYPLYQMQFEAIIEYQQDCYKSPNSGFGGWLYGDFLTEQAPAGGWDAYLGGQSVKMPKGLKVKLQGTATFTKMESGWNLGKVEIKHSENITNP